MIQLAERPEKSTLRWVMDDPRDSTDRDQLFLAVTSYHNRKLLMVSGSARM